MKRSGQMQRDRKAELLECGKAAGAGVLVAAGLILGAILLGILLLYGVSFAATHYDPYLSQKQTVKMVEQYQEELDAYMEAGDFSSLPDISMLNPGFQRVTAGEGYVEMTCGRTGGDDAHQSWGILYIEDPAVQISWWGLEFYADQEYISDRVGTYGEYNMYLERIRDRYYFYCWGE